MSVARVVLELFAGGGGAATGLAQAGWRHLACVEHDPDACAVARALGLPVIRADVGALPVAARPDLVWASPPCQPFSAAGKRLADADERDGFPALFAALDRLRPTWLLVEQVPGLLSHKARHGAGCSGCYLEGVVLPGLRARFAHVEHRVLSAADHGAPQDRRRLIVACGPAPFPWPAPTHSAESGPTLWGDAASSRLPWHTMREALGIEGDWMVDTGSAGKPGREAQRTLDQVAATVGGRGNVILRCGEVKRRLTPAECALLQAWPEVVPALAALRTKAAAYRVVGNAVSPPMARALGSALLGAP